MKFVILTGGIELSVGAMVALSAIIAASTMEAGWPSPLACVAVLAAGAFLGLLHGLVIHYFDVQPFIATLAGMFPARGLGHLLARGRASRPAARPLPIHNAAFTDFAERTITFGDYYITYAVVVGLVIVGV